MDVTRYYASLYCIWFIIEMADKFTTVLIFPFAAVGHMYPTIGVGQTLVKHGYRVIFAVNDQWKGKVCPYGLEEVDLPNDFKHELTDAAQHFAKFMQETGLLSDLTPVKKYINLCRQWETILPKINKKLDEEAQILIKQIRPDLIMLDHTYRVPAIELSGIPWIVICCLNPLDAIKHDKTPPCSSGKFLLP